MADLTRQLFRNNLEVEIDSDGITSTDTDIPLKAGEGTKVGAIGTDEHVLATLLKRSGGVETDHEVVRVYSRSGDTLTVVRDVEGLGASAFSGGDFVSFRLTAGTLTALRQQRMQTLDHGSVDYNAGPVLLDPLVASVHRLNVTDPDTGGTLTAEVVPPSSGQVEESASYSMLLYAQGETSVQLDIDADYTITAPPHASSAFQSNEAYLTRIHIYPQVYGFHLVSVVEYVGQFTVIAA